MVSSNEAIYDGQISPNGTLNGFLRIVTYDGESTIGWWKNGYRYGNTIWITPGGKILERLTGWYENHERKGPLKRNSEFKGYTPQPFSMPSTKDMLKNE